MSGTSEAVSQATRLSEIGFPEFTTKLITDVFDALVSSNLRQTQAYIELLQETSKTLTNFINDTKDDISGEMILDFLATVLPASPTSSENDGQVTALVQAGEEATLDSGQLATLNSALYLPEHKAEGGISANNQITGETNYNTILDAVAKRIAANKYDLLKEMVKLGILRLVVERGEIETRLSFSTYGSSFSRNTLSKYNRKDFEVKAKAKTGKLISKWVEASASTKYTDVKVSTSNSTNQDSSSASVNIIGGVKIIFKTDYLPLNQ